jgi:hypothetical protein
MSDSIKEFYSEQQDSDLEEENDKHGNDIEVGTSGTSAAEVSEEAPSLPPLPPESNSTLSTLTKLINRQSALRSDSINIINEINNSLCDADDDDGEELIISVDPDDFESFTRLSDWFINAIEIVPSLARKYSETLLSHGIPSLSRLAKKLIKESNVAVLNAAASHHHHHGSFLLLLFCYQFLLYRFTFSARSFFPSAKHNTYCLFHRIFN